MMETDVADAATPPARRDPIEDLARALLVELGEDPGREGLAGTPARFARWWREFMNYDPGSTATVFESVGDSQLVEVNGIRVWSMCEHHLLPFSCDLSIAYLTRGTILGLSKFARIGQQHAHKLQVQERLTADIADSIEKATGSADVAVRATGKHLCMTIRGVRTPADMTTSVLRGVFRDDPSMVARLAR